MKKLLLVLLTTTGSLALVGCTDDHDHDHDHGDLENGFFEVTGEGGLNGDVTLSVNVVDKKIDSIRPIAFEETDSYFKTAWDELEDKLIGLDAHGITELSDSDIVTGASKASTAILDAVDELLEVDTDDIMYDLDLLDDVEDLDEEYGKIFQKANTGYYRDGTTYNEVATDVDRNQYEDSDVIAIQVGTQRATAIEGTDGYDDGYYLMGATGPQRLTYREFIQAEELTIIIGVDGSDDTPAPVVPATVADRSSLTSVIDFLTTNNKLDVTTVTDKDDNDITNDTHTDLQVTSIFIDGAIGMPSFVWSNGEFINMMTQTKMTENDLINATDIALKAYTYGLPDNSITGVNDFLTNTSLNGGLGLANVIFVTDSNEPTNTITDIEQYAIDNPTHTVSAIYPVVPKSGMPAIWNVSSWMGLTTDLMTNAEDIMVVISIPTESAH